MATFKLVCLFGLLAIMQPHFAHAMRPGTAPPPAEDDGSEEDVETTASQTSSSSMYQNPAMTQAAGVQMPTAPNYGMYGGGNAGQMQNMGYGMYGGGNAGQMQNMGYGMYGAGSADQMTNMGGANVGGQSFRQGSMMPSPSMNMGGGYGAGSAGQMPNMGGANVGGQSFRQGSLMPSPSMNMSGGFNPQQMAGQPQLQMTPEQMQMQLLQQQMMMMQAAGSPVNTPSRAASRRLPSTTSSSSLGGGGSASYQLAYEFRFAKGEFVPYPLSELQWDELQLLPYMLDASVAADLKREWLQDSELTALGVSFKDNQRVSIAFDKLARHINPTQQHSGGAGSVGDNQQHQQQSALCDKVQPNDMWGEKLCKLHKSWTQDTASAQTTKAKSKYLKQLIAFSVLGRAMLLYVSLYNATFGMAQTDTDDLNEILVSMTSDERNRIHEIHRKYNKKWPNLCKALVEEENSIKIKKLYAKFVLSLCAQNRNPTFMEDTKEYSNSKLEEGAQLLKEMVKRANEMTGSAKDARNKLNQFWAEKIGNSDISNGTYVQELLTKANYERLRSVVHLHYENMPRELHGAIENLKKIKKPKPEENDALSVLMLVRMIVIDAVYGRPYLFSLVLRDKLERLNLAAANKKDDEDAFNDASRIFLLRAPVDLADIGDVYQKAVKLFYNPPPYAKNKGPSKLLTEATNYDDAKRLNEDALLMKHLREIKERFGEAQHKDDEKYAVHGYIGLLSWLTDKAENKDGTWVPVVHNAEQNEEEENENEQGGVIMENAAVMKLYDTDRYDTQMVMEKEYAKNTEKWLDHAVIRKNIANKKTSIGTLKDVSNNGWMMGQQGGASMGMAGGMMTPQMMQQFALMQQYGMMQPNQFGGMQPNQFGGMPPNQYGMMQPNRFGGQGMGGMSSEQ